MRRLGDQDAGRRDRGSGCAQRRQADSLGFVDKFTCEIVRGRLQIIEDYEHRWLIEEYHKVIKSGCSIEKHALRTADRLEPLIGLISVIGPRLFELKLLGRNETETKARGHVPSSWLKCISLLRPDLKITALTVYEFFRELAKLGGFLGRKSDGEPGWQTIWRGYRKMQSLLDALKLTGQL